MVHDTHTRRRRRLFAVFIVLLYDRLISLSSFSIYVLIVFNFIVYYTCNALFYALVDIVTVKIHELQ